MPKTVFITGASSGFGESIAHRFAQNGDRLVLNGRRKDRLETLASRLQVQFNSQIHLSVFDVQDRIAVQQAVEDIPASFKNIDILINNAGLALGRDLFQDADISDWETMFQTNVMGLLYVTRAVLPWMQSSKCPHIINMGSIAGKEVYQRGNVYCASKAAVNSLSKSMRTDLLEKGFKVTAIHPGAAETEFSNVRFKGDTIKAAAMYEGYQALSAKDVAEIVYYTTTLPEHVCINDLEVTCVAQASSFYTHKVS
jgi:NADP-dependent 3-hydroxy acid dehydrogenase YdfG